MTDAIRYLEMLGGSPAADAVANAACHAMPECSLQCDALAKGDLAGLRALLGGRAFMAMHVLAPDEEPSREAPVRREDDATEPAEGPQEEQPD